MMGGRGPQKGFGGRPKKTIVLIKTRIKGGQTIPIEEDDDRWVLSLMHCYLNSDEFQESIWAGRLSDKHKANNHKSAAELCLGLINSTGIHVNKNDTATKNGVNYNKDGSINIIFGKLPNDFDLIKIIERICSKYRNIFGIRAKLPEKRDFIKKISLILNSFLFVEQVRKKTVLFYPKKQGVGYKNQDTMFLRRAKKQFDNHETEGMPPYLKSTLLMSLYANEIYNDSSKKEAHDQLCNLGFPIEQVEKNLNNYKALI